MEPVMRTEQRNAREKLLAEHVGALVHGRRTKMGLTLAQLGKLANVDPSQLSKLERGEGIAGASSYVDLERALCWQPGEMLTVAIRETYPLAA